ncbi:MAG: tail fiber domain-containing protein [Candidatus Kapaibacterium sp.]
MKKIITILLILLTTTIINSQTPYKFSYQAVVRDANNELITNKSISVKISILSDSVTGDVVYSEISYPKTNDNGLISLQIGASAFPEGDIESIDWSKGEYFIKTEIDPNGKSDYTIISTTQLISVPYALHASTADRIAGGGDGSPTDRIIDKDGNTRVEVEKNNDENIIRFTLDGEEKWTMTGNRLESSNQNNNILIGKQAGRTIYNGEGNIAIGDSSLFRIINGNFNIAFGLQSLNNNTSGGNNVSIGTKSLYLNNTGSNNTAIGHEAIFSNNYGSFNVANGFQALYNNNQGNGNCAIGSSSLYSNTKGGRNSAVGYQSLYSNTEGARNSAIGSGALYSNITGDDNTACGAESMNKNTAGAYNTATGRSAMQYNTTGNSNAVVGYNTLSSNSSGHYNSALGATAMIDNTTGNANTAVGYLALRSNVNGSNNVSIGTLSLKSNISGEFNTTIGYLSDNADSNFTNSMSLGHKSLSTASDMVRVGNENITSIGGAVNWTTISDGRFKVNVVENVKGLQFINQLRPVTYTMDLRKIEQFYTDNFGIVDSSKWDTKYDKENITYTGFIAQEVEQAAKANGFDFSGVDAPKNEKDFYGLRYAEFVVPLVKSVQELSKQLEEKTWLNEDYLLELESQKTKINDLQKQIDELRDLILVSNTRKE